MAVERDTFTLPDFLIFSLMLAFSACTGLYYVIVSIRESRKRPYQSMEDELTGKSDKHPIKLGLNIFINFISAITYLGIPSEVYFNGSLFWVISWSFLPACIVFNNVFLPVMYRLRPHSFFDYLEMRFGRYVRLLGVVLNFINLLVFMSMSMYGLALALSAVTGVVLWGAILSIGLVRTVFTVISGVTLHLWVEMFQVFLMLLGFLLLIVGSCLDADGIADAWERAEADDRVQLLDLTFDPSQRYTMWSLLIGGTFLTLCFIGPNQFSINNYRSCKTEGEARLAVWVGLGLSAIFVIMACVVGIFMYSFYHSCDPYSAGILDRPAELLPYFIVDLYSELPGTPGLLISALFAASLSSTSAGLNSLASTTINDLIQVKWTELSTVKYTILKKLCAGIYGLICMSLAFLISGLQNILQITLSWAGVLGGPVLGIFTLGAYSSMANSKGAISGGITGLSVGCFFLFGSIACPPSWETMELYTDNCPADIAPRSLHNYFKVSEESESNVRISRVAKEESGSIQAIFSLSYMYYSVITWFVTVVVGLIVSCCTAKEEVHDSSLTQAYGCLPGRCKGRSNDEDKVDYCEPDSQELDQWQAFSADYQ